MTSAYDNYWDDIEITEALEAHHGLRLMFGVDGGGDSACVADYDPWAHAEILDLPIVFRDDLPEDAVAAFSAAHQAIFVRPNLHAAVERCALAHEIVHFEHNDIGTDDLQEERADRIAARRLIRPSRLEELASVTDDPAVVALEMNVTEKIMRVWMRLHRAGLIRGF
ncbi:ImmA/IrrE family metallo-endopeptidase [Microbacterium sp. IEGM 1404]|uniref:ImmA/IrrE family metallo-endopeptidase n=1 Tax=Microbacterium sp. IEGM 1404 TaxID=3047084 RepID=UPI0024B86C3E|nr:ImmA/IrrE family metallo-endopeptidase [Microbacterium sp. IEGM 1404]MDI9889926.1 ImmA/IrrE family metallo-endopeptidase [Microbacterium sp. IEGM 1404]